MRGLVLEVVAIFGGAVILVAASLALLTSDPGWFSRTVDYLQAGLTFQFGYSNTLRDDVIVGIGRAALKTGAIVAGTAVILAAIGVPLGIAAALRPESRRVAFWRGLAGAVSSLPVLFWGTFTYIAFVRRGVVLRPDANLVLTMVMAALVVACGDRVLADIVQRVAQRTRQVLEEPYMRTVAVAQLGFRRHVLQSLAPSVAEALASRAVFLLSGAIVAESVFEINGLGLTVIKSIERGDQEPLVVLAAAMAFVILGLAFRVLYRLTVVLCDPSRA